GGAGGGGGRGGGGWPACRGWGGGCPRWPRWPAGPSRHWRGAPGVARGRSRGGDLVCAAGCIIWFRVWRRDRTDPAADEPGEPAVTFDTSRPSIARVYDVMLGGKDNFAADREVAAQLVAAYPLFANWAQDNRVLLARAASYAASRGVRQVIDVGSGLPTSPNTHEIARREVPGARVVYVDNDPMVIAHIRALLASDDGIAAVEGDLRDPEA